LSEVPSASRAIPILLAVTLFVVVALIGLCGRGGKD
jgi:hypothetical protein